MWKLKDRVGNKIGDGRDLEKTIHQTIKKVTEDIENMKFNTAVSSLMVLVNEMEKLNEISMNYYSALLILLNPFAPHITEELWDGLCNNGLCWNSEWPKYNPKLAKESKIDFIIQVNGKVRDKIEAGNGLSEAKAKKIALSSDKMIKYIKGKKIKNVIFIKDKLINFVV